MSDPQKATLVTCSSSEEPVETSMKINGDDKRQEDSVLNSEMLKVGSNGRGETSMKFNGDDKREEDSVLMSEMVREVRDIMEIDDTSHEEEHKERSQNNQVPEPPSMRGTTMESIQLFSKSLSKSDVEHRLSIPGSSLKHFPIPEGKDSVCFNVVDTVGRSWSFSVTVRRGHYPKPVISGDWTSFVRATGSKVGDIVSFDKHIDADGGVQFKITVRRRIFNVLANIT